MDGTPRHQAHPPGRRTTETTARRQLTLPQRRTKHMSPDSEARRRRCLSTGRESHRTGPQAQRRTFDRRTVRRPEGVNNELSRQKMMAMGIRRRDPEPRCRDGDEPREPKGEYEFTRRGQRVQMGSRSKGAARQ